MIVTSEYVYNNIELCEVNDFIEKTRVEQDRKNGYNGEEIEINFNVKFLDKIKNKTKSITTKSIKKSIITSQNRYEFFKINNLIIIIVGSI